MHFHTQRDLYEKYHRNNLFENFGESTFMGHFAAASYPDAKTTLDFGCGNGYAVRRMRQNGSEWYGLEYSEAAKELHLKEPYFYVGTTKQFDDGQFDLGYSTEVMEHIPEEIINETISDFCRVVSKYLFLTISLRPSSDNNKYHCTLRPRSWWEQKFEKHGFEVDRRIQKLHQHNTLKSTSNILKEWKNLGPDAEEFCKNPPFNLNGEREPWFFCFKRVGTISIATPEPRVSWSNRELIPRIRKILKK